MKEKITRCSWANTDNILLRNYHDNEWGRPCHDNQKLFELLSLEIMQAGLSWQTVLNKRQAFKGALANFNYQIVQTLTPQLSQLLTNSKIIRNQKKLSAIISNAKVLTLMELRQKTFDQYLWNFVNNIPIQHHYHSHEEIPRTNQIAKQISRQMKKDGFRFTGPIVVYSFMQAAGLINDHEISCYRYTELLKCMDNGYK